LRKVVITGPESTGKSTLARQLSLFYHGAFTEELARSYLSQLDRPYAYDDLKAIAALQIEREDQLEKDGVELLFCDTDLLTIKIWSSYKYAKVDPRILDWINRRDYDLYLLCKPDIPWEADPLRENPNNRDELFDLHLEELNHYHKDFEIVEGLREERLQNAVSVIEKYKRYW
jgi:NadR type nicotinamide-nucleotide adenylyltransferase